MPREIVLIPEAVRDANDGYWWYEEQDAGLGEEFLRCLAAAYAKITENPEHYPARIDSFRQILIRRFPYAIYYEHDERTVWIHCIFHCSQDPKTLLKRLKGK